MDDQEKKPEDQTPLVEIRDDDDGTPEGDAAPQQDPAPEPAPNGPGTWDRIQEALRALKFDPQMSVRGLDAMLGWARRTFPPELFERIADGSVTYGHYALLAAQFLSVLLGLVAAIKLSSIAFLFRGMGIALLLVILQYTAAKFLNAGRSLLKASPSRMGSAAFLDCLALLSEVLGILAFLACLAQGSPALVFVGLGLWALCDAIAYIALNPSMVNITIATDVRAGEEAIGIMSFLVKAVVRIVPIAFGVGTSLGAIALLCAIFSLMKTGDMGPAKASNGLLVLCACLPFATYVIFALYHLTIDLMRSILLLPRKLDEMETDRG